MAIVAGIDEAGLGPILGPLVVTGVAVRLPEPLAEADLWQVLASAVARKVLKRQGRLVIADSKKLYKPEAGLTLLERGVLGAASALDGAAAGSLRSLLGWLSPPAVDEMDLYPWFVERDLNLPTCCDPVDVRLRGNGLRSALEKEGASLAGMRCEVLQTSRYNQLIAATDNKATTAFDQTCRLIDWVCRAHSQERTIRLYVDRQGGREHYLPGLQRMFEADRFRILMEKPAHSSYRIEMANQEIEIHFLEKGETHHLTIALASMTSKYIRELFMELFNRYWAGHLPNLRPTAGYYGDGQRFLDDIAPLCRQLNTPSHLLIRCR